MCAEKNGLYRRRWWSVTIHGHEMEPDFVLLSQQVFTLKFIWKSTIWMSWQFSKIQVLAMGLFLSMLSTIFRLYNVINSTNWSYGSLLSNSTNKLQSDFESFKILQLEILKAAEIINRFSDLAIFGGVGVRYRKVSFSHIFSDFRRIAITYSSDFRSVIESRARSNGSRDKKRLEIITSCMSEYT